MAPFFTFSTAAQSAKFNSVDNAAFSKVIAQKEAQLVDVRTPSEFIEGHLPGAINFNVNEDAFDRQITTLNESYPVAVYCRSGARSQLAAHRLSEAGYHVVNLKGGISGWEGPVVKR